jgi:hypothetical protein
MGGSRPRPGLDHGNAGHQYRQHGVAGDRARSGRGAGDIDLDRERLSDRVGRHIVHLRRTGSVIRPGADLPHRRRRFHRRLGGVRALAPLRAAAGGARSPRARFIGGLRDHARALSRSISACTAWTGARNQRDDRRHEHGGRSGTGRLHPGDRVVAVDLRHQYSIRPRERRPQPQLAARRSQCRPDRRSECAGERARLRSSSPV